MTTQGKISMPVIYCVYVVHNVFFCGDWFRRQCLLLMEFCHSWHGFKAREDLFSVLSQPIKYAGESLEYLGKTCFAEYSLYFRFPSAER